MAETSRDHSGDQVNLDIPIFSAPQYQINYGDDYTLQWTPPVGSKELAVALSYYFPLQKDLESKMQTAIKVFLHQEQIPSRETEQVKSSYVERSTMRQQLSTPPTESSTTSNPESRPAVSPTLQILTWDSKMKEFNPKIKRRRYEKDERAKVAANRGFACERHRRQKMKCDPERCSQNKQRLNGLDATSKPEDEFLTSQPAPEYNVPAETNQPVPTQPDDLSLRSFTPSDTSPRWSWSSFVDSAKSFSEDFYSSDQYTDLPTPSLENSSRCHDSIGSVLSEAYDLDFLANYDPISLAINQSKSNVWSARDISGVEDSDFENDLPFPTENAVASSSIHDASRTFALDSGNGSAFEPPTPWSFGDYSHGKDDAITTGAIPEAALECVVSMPCVVESLVDPAPMRQHEDKTLMNWESGHPTTAVPRDFRHGQEIIPLTNVQRETLIKWWGKDRFTEQPRSLFGRSSRDEERTSSFDLKDTSGGEASLREKNSLVNKVKGAHIPPPFRKGLWRSSSSGKQGK
ncbi:uncharacterized protein PAC_19105 [Phialocephala subalpina]|uniref:Uncharacterized protein n=1 Tax=Phialocephala subalpina TaxID=576137 RepID=A0A1L7XW46_9HELO|nr:uncharacterized protein PAC_19105 [Phialocephala subalpina]